MSRYLVSTSTFMLGFSDAVETVVAAVVGGVGVTDIGEGGGLKTTGWSDVGDIGLLGVLAPDPAEKTGSLGEAPRL